MMVTIKMTINAGTNAEGITMYMCVMTFIWPTVVLYAAAVILKEEIILLSD